MKIKHTASSLSYFTPLIASQQKYFKMIQAVAQKFQKALKASSAISAKELFRKRTAQIFMDSLCGMAKKSGANVLNMEM